MKLSLVIILLFSSWLSATEGVLTMNDVAEIQKNFKMDDKTTLIQNAVTSNSIDSLAVNYVIASKNDSHFTHTVPYAEIRNQSSSGRCWIFAGLNCLRTQVMKEKDKKDFKLSASYLSFWDKMEKANLFLERAISMRDRDYLDREWMLTLEHSLGEGGWWNYATGLISKYGVVPEDAMPETKSSLNSSLMNKIYTAYLKKCASDIRQKSKTPKELRVYKKDALKEIYRFLVINLGEPPMSFKHLVDSEKKDKPVYKNFTPQGFYKEYIGLNLDDYKCLFHNPALPYNKYYSYRLSKAMKGSQDFNYVNLPIDQLKKYCQKSIMNKEAIWFAADVGKDQHKNKGLMKVGIKDYSKLFDLNLKMSKADRMKTLAGTSNHAMVFIGMDLQADGKVKKWLVENSWGTKLGDKGKWHLYDSWFDEYVYAVIINKKYLSPETNKIFESKAKELAPWHP